MKLFGMELNKRMAVWFSLHGLIIVDILLITIAFVFPLPKNIAQDIQFFDLFVCALLLIEWSINFYLSTPKTVFLKQRDNIVALVASIPFDFILSVSIPGVNLLRYLRILKLLRIIVLFNRFVDGLKIFINKTNLDKIFGGMVFTVFVFTLLMYIFGPSYGLFDDFYFVVVTLTTVGYGDVTPVTFNEKVITLALIIIGILIFSTITAAISSYLTERLMKKGDEEMEADIENTINENFEILNTKLENLDEENKLLREEIRQLKDLIEK